MVKPSNEFTKITRQRSLVFRIIILIIKQLLSLFSCFRFYLFHMREFKNRVVGKLAIVENILENQPTPPSPSPTPTPTPTPSPSSSGENYIEVQEV